MITQAHTPIHDAVWMVCAPFLQSALDKTKNLEWTLTDARKWVDSGEGVLLYAEDNDGVFAGAIIGMSKYHRINAMEVYLMGAKNGSRWEPLFADLIDYAKSEGCQRIDVAGRRWIKFLQKFGTARETFRAELTI